jgi:hypothetical protein
MGATPLTAEKLAEVKRLIALGLTHRRIARELNLSLGVISRAKHSTKVPEPVIEANKKEGEFDIDEWLDWMEQGQSLKKKASYSQNDATIKLGDGSTPQVICPQGDWHICSWGTDHKLVRAAIQEINETPNAWFPLIGDMVQMSIKMRSVLEVSDNMVPPELQCAFLEQLLEKIIDKVPFSCWCNHGVEREEKQSGISMVKHVLARRTVYFNGIGHPDIQVGDQVYKCAVSHRWRGASMYDSTFGNKRYARMEANDREIIFQADLHRPAFGTYYEGGMKRTALTCGTFQTGSGYAQRYFTLKTWPVMPAIVLHGDRHLAVPFEKLSQALKYIGQ